MLHNDERNARRGAEMVGALNRGPEEMQQRSPGPVKGKEREATIVPRPTTLMQVGSVTAFHGRERRLRAVK